MTIFEKIANHEIPAKLVHEDEYLIAFHDINPQAPYHIVIVPRKPIPSLTSLTRDDTELMGKMTLLASELAQKLGFADEGYRLVINCGKNGGQTVDHIHMHLLGGRQLAWPPG
ncbi:MAG TPA: histidine triad nucleotide-binding protein [Candidatus Kapabacteria bacterium]|jgi:histidine triad (HIT) family protein